MTKRSKLTRIFLSRITAFQLRVFNTVLQNRARPGLSHVKPVAVRATLGDAVYRELRDALSVGRFDPGEALTIGAISDAFNTSHMPAREALRRLVAEGALEVGTSGSAKVPSVDARRLDDITEARVLLERRATELAVVQASAEDLTEIDRLARIHAEIANHRDVYDMLLKNRRFHFAIYRASHSAVLPPLIESLWLQYGPYMRLLSDHLNAAREQGGHGVYAEGHRRIVAAIRAGDAEAAADAIEADIRRTRFEMQEPLRALAG
ncbi:GntR family transcriptional regulator [uncultured Paracoccus sp.]|uniref:GntR family transcriptional regulator n=1 Tax=uncultured Paracoccus sp. TaxID=189685 RepID=UPI0026023C3C|nr:GntR family transcriptional regulator [uncultured Paracoccus sp.]